MEHIAARTFALQMGDMERFDRLIASTETRRAACLREIERHRAALARDMRSAEDVEDSDVDTEVVERVHEPRARPAQIDPRDGLVADAYVLDEADEGRNAFA